MSAPSAEPKWTPSQRDAIEHVDGALLVSAAAGSGKTAVLAARCAHLVCDAADPCDVDELLVLTFTRAAAAEMRERIDRAIRRRAESPDAPERVLRQLRLIDRAQVTTIDAFCGQLVREHFHLLGVDPAFRVLAPEDAALLRSDVVSRLIDAEYDSPRAPSLYTLLNGYFSGDDARMSRQIIAAHNLLQSIVEPAAWVEASLKRLRDGASESSSALLRQFAAIQQRALRSAVRRLEVVAERAAVREGLAKYATHARAIAVELGEWLALSLAGDFDALAPRVSAHKLDRLPSVPKETPGKAELQAEIDAVKKRIKTGDLNRLLRWTRTHLREDLARITPLAEHFFDLVHRFDAAYARAKRDLRSLDFADTESMALRVLRADVPGVLRPSGAAIEMHRRYRHVLVDEYQDINPLQNAILRLASRDAHAEAVAGDAPAARSNLFSVGDVKQSIYRFRLAEPQQFIDRRASLREPANRLGRVIDLQENFRSRAPLLDAVNDVFRLLMTDASTGIAYDETHELRSPGDYPPTDGPHFTGKPIELHVLPRELTFGDDAADGDGEEEADSFEREIAFVAEYVRDLVRGDPATRRQVAARDGGGLAYRPVRYGDVVVLLRSAKYKSSQVADALRARDVPVHSDDATGFFNATEVQDVLSVLRVLSNGRQDVPLAAVIRSPFSPIAHKEDALARVRIAYPDEPYHRAVARYAGEHTDALASQLAGLLAQLGRWRQMFRETPVGESLSRIYDFNGFLTFNRALPDGEQRVANLRVLQERGAAFDSFERQGLDRFLAFLRELEESDQLGRPSLGADAGDVVRVMTVHKSKGLEFPVVIVPDLGKRFNTMSLQEPILLDRDLGIGMATVELRRRIRYPSAASIVVRDHARRQAIAEEIRVMYVALTRAREHLVLIGSAKEGAVAQWDEDYANHDGPLPDDAVQDAATALDWIGPIAAITRRAGLGTFEVIDHAAPADQAPFEDGHTDGADASPADALATWPPADAINVTAPDALLAIDRLTYAYPHVAATAQRSTQRVVEFVNAALPEVSGGSTVTLEWPAVYRADARPKATDVGTATHRVLQFLDFRGPLDAAGVAAQMDALLVRKLIAPLDARIVDVDSIVWFAGTELAALMRADGARLFREQSLAIALPMLGGGATGDDRVLVRGRVDALVAMPDGLTLVDYKSDRVAAEFAGARAASYAPQMLGYAGALANITGIPVRRACLVMLQARRIIDVPLGPAAT